MSTHVIAANVAIVLLVLTAAAAGPAGAAPVPSRPSIDATPPESGTRAAASADLRNVDAIQTRLRSERAVLDDLMGVMLVENRLYDRLADLQFERVVHRSRMDERVGVQRAALGDLSRRYYSMQHEPERLADFVYEIGRSMETLDSLHDTTVEQRALVAELRERIESENETLDDLDTPLAGALADQRASQLRGLDYVAEQLAIQGEALRSARTLQEDRLEYAEHYQAIWRELETVERDRVLDRLEAEYDETHRGATLRSSRFQGERYVVALLQQHHHARMETVVEYTSLLWSVEDDLQALDGQPSAAEVESAQAALDEEMAALSDVRDALATESAVTSDLREELQVHERVLVDRERILWRQTDLVSRLETQSTVERQGRTVTALERAIDDEAALLDALDEHLDEERRLVGELFDAGTASDASGRLAAYLRARDDVAELLVANLDVQERLVGEQQAALVSRQRAVYRLGWSRGVQDLWRKLPAFDESVRLDRLDAAVLEDRFDGQREAFGLLTDLRREADGTFADQQDLLLSVRDDLDRIETAAPASDGGNAALAANATDASAHGSIVPAGNASDGSVVPAGTASDGADGPARTADAAGESDATADGGGAALEAASEGAAVDDGDRSVQQLAAGGRNAGGGGLAGISLVMLLLLASFGAIFWLVREDYRRLAGRRNR